MARAPRSFRFLTEAGAVADGKALAETARRAEATGIDVLVLADHLINPFEAVATRVARLEEAVAVLKRSFGRSPSSFNGDHYTITGLDARPKPIQRPHPPLFIGGGGRRLLSLAGREADIVGFAPRLLPGVRGDPRSITIAATEEKIGWVREAAGARFDRLELNIYPSMSPVMVTDHARRAASRLASRLAQRTGVEVSPDDLLDSPHIFIGSVDQLVEKFRSLRERLGVSSIMVGTLDELPGVVERLAGT